MTAPRLLITGKFLSSVAYFAALPFLTLYLSTTCGLSKPMAGALAGTVALVSAVGGLSGGYLTDRFGSLRLMKAGLALYVACYVGLALTRTLIGIVPLLGAMGVARMVLEPSSKKLMSACSEGGGIFRMRYLTVALGAVVGPPTGAALYSLGLVPFFLLPGALLLAYLALVLARGAVLAPFDGRSPGRPDRVPMRSLLTNRVLLATVVGGMFFFVIFSQFESMLPLLLHQLQGPRGVTLFSLALAGDAVVAIAIQVPLIKLGERVSQRSLTAFGSICFALAFIGFALMAVTIWALAGSVLFFALGESVLFPMPDVYLHKVAPERHKAAYFGIGELRYLGFLIGPTLGGWLLGLGPVVFGVCFAAGALACLPLFLDIDRQLSRAGPRSSTLPSVSIPQTEAQS